ncbi:MAG: hypothetical protein H6810_01015 [Phycisphaeraceae bacterium]|nr:MAG: hypothetical protein H6810_01015 [Phycisphaeraceae bacterium]
MNERPARPSSPRGRLWCGVSCIAVLALPLVWAGCSIKKHYELLSFFFDGVPNPNAMPIAAAAGDPRTMRQSPTYSAHRPYLDGQCAECHGRGFSTTSVEPTVCLKCHQSVQREHRFMHGPVAFGACLLCHVPHESAYASLFKGDSRQVCMQCHDKTMLSGADVPEHLDDTTACLTCHYGHGAEVRYMLRDREATPQNPPRDGAEPGRGG